MNQQVDVLRRWARALRASAEYADSSQARGAELDRAAELERRAEAIEREGMKVHSNTPSVTLCDILLPAKNNRDSC